MILKIPQTPLWARVTSLVFAIPVLTSCSSHRLRDIQFTKYPVVTGQTYNQSGNNYFPNLDKSKEYIVYFVGVPDDLENAEGVNLPIIRSIIEASPSNLLDNKIKPFHVGGAFYDDKLGWRVVQSALTVGNDVSTEQPLEEGLKSYSTVATLIIAVEADLSSQFLRDMVGKQYGTLDFAQQAIRYGDNVSSEVLNQLSANSQFETLLWLQKVVPKKVFDLNIDGPGVTCSELVAKSLAGSSPLLSFLKGKTSHLGNLSSVTPTDLLEKQLLLKRAPIYLKTSNDRGLGATTLLDKVKADLHIEPR